MSQQRVFNIVITDDQGSPYWDNYDVFDVYYDNVTEGFVVKLNGGAYGGPEDVSLGDYGTHWYAGSGTPSGNYIISDYSFCDGTTLNWFRIAKSHPSFPFAERQLTTNSPSCQPIIVCDIQFTGPAEITHAETVTGGDGSFSVQATSSNGTVKYNIGDFDYGTEGQATGDFTGLNPGSYEVYAKDGYCTAHQTITILYKPVEGEYRRLTWTDDFGLRTSQLSIYQKGYIGSPVELEYSLSPFTWFKPIPDAADINDKFYPVHPGRAEINLDTERKYEYLIFYTLDNQRFHCIYRVNEGAGYVNQFQGFISPQQSFGGIVSAPYTWNFKITDNLANLKNVPFVDETGNILRGQVSLIKILAFCLQQTGLSLNIRCGINIFEAAHEQLSDGSSDPLVQTYEEVACYKDATGPFSCYQVIEKILRPFGARVVQTDGVWLLDEINSRLAAYDYREFDSAGNYLSNGTFDPIIDDIDFLDPGQGQEIVPAYGKITVRSILNYIGSIVSGGFEKEDLVSSDNDQDFSGWALRPNGTSGVTFKRVDYFEFHSGKSGKSDKTFTLQDIRNFGFPLPQAAFLAQFPQPPETRSVGAFTFDPIGWEENLREAYIESEARPIKYRPEDRLSFQFDFLAKNAIGYEFAVIRFAIKIGNDYLQPDLSWAGTESILRFYPTPSQEFEKFEFSFAPPQGSGLTISTIQTRIYFYAAEFFDYGLPDDTGGADGLAGLKAETTADKNYDFRADFLYNIPVLQTFRVFVELRRGTLADTFPAGSDIRPDDYAGGTNEKLFHVIKVLGYNGLNVNPDFLKGVDTHRYLIDNVVMDFLPQGDPPTRTEEIPLAISKYIPEELEVELYNFDISDPLITKNANAENMYNNYFRLADGTPTSSWSRAGETEDLTIQQILMKVLGANYSAPTFRIRGQMIQRDRRISPSNYIKFTKLGSSLVVTNTGFDTDLSDWTGDGSSAAFAWVVTNGGSAEVSLSGVQDSEKLYQAISHQGGYIKVIVNVQAANVVGAREDNLVLLMYKNGLIIHTERIRVFTNIETDFNFEWTAFAPSSIDAIGFFFQNVAGDGDGTYRVGTFNPQGTNIEEVYMISDYKFIEKQNLYELELTQINQTYISLAGIDQGGTGQGGGEQGTQFSGAYSNAYGGSYDTILLP